MRRLIFIILTVSFLFACNGAKKAGIQMIDDESVSQVFEDDAEMNAAMETAKSTFSKFKTVFSDNQKSNKYHTLCIKIGFPSEKYGKEHMWVGNLMLKEDTFYGILDNKPLDESIKYQMGDTVVVNPEQISDWMYIDSTTGLAYGGYTFKVIRKKLSTAEREQFDRQTGLTFEE